MIQSVSYPKSKKIEVGGISVEVKALKTRQYLEFFGRLEDIPATFMGVLNAAGRGEDVAPYIAVAVTEAAGEILDLLAFATGTDRDWLLDETEPDELLDLVLAVIEVNRLPEKLGKFRAAFASVKEKFAIKLA